MPTKRSLQASFQRVKPEAQPESHITCASGTAFGPLNPEVKPRKYLSRAPGSLPRLMCTERKTSGLSSRAPFPQAEACSCVMPCKHAEGSGDANRSLCQPKTLYLPRKGTSFSDMHRKFICRKNIFLSRTIAHDQIFRKDPVGI